MKTREEIMQELIDETHENWMGKGHTSVCLIEEAIRQCRSDPDLARYVRQRMNEIIHEAEKYGD